MLDLLECRDKLLVDGWAVVPPSPESLIVANACANLPLEFISSGKMFLRKIFKEDSPNVPQELYDFSVRSDALAVTEAYLKEPVKVASLRLFHSVYVGGPPLKSQLYHCDGGFDDMVKLFIYCSDVGPENGPFSYLPMAVSSELWKKTDYATTRRLTDEQVERAVGKVTPLQWMGPKGTVCLVDTSKMFHFGARVNKGAAPRLVVAIQYVRASENVRACHDEYA